MVRLGLVRVQAAAQQAALQPQPLRSHPPPSSRQHITHHLSLPPLTYLPPVLPHRYFDQVIPSEYGLQRPWYFLFTPSYWCGTTAAADEAAAAAAAAPTTAPLNMEGAAGSDDQNVEPLALEADPEPLPSDRGVRIERLRKAFANGPNGGVAVSNLDLQMRPGHITSLLGANGAGKTTTISMLTGLIPPTSGTAYIGDKSILTSMRSIRRSLGVCPQQNVLFFTLTPREHLLLHGELKGLYGTQLLRIINEMLALVGLAERANVPSASLSGGQKRKLCLAIALLGQPTTTFLDEPTSGMDPHSRRAIWALLRTQREGRTLVLTTHFLDEAEILSDRIAIMAEGALRCAGSPLFLKTRLGCGYRLTVSKQQSGSDASSNGQSKAAFTSEALLSFLRKYEPEADLTVDERFYAEVNLPSGSIEGFAQLFKSLDASLTSLGIKEYGLTCTTLEDVFLRINQNNLERLDKVRNRHHLIPPTPQATPQATPQPPERRGVPNAAPEVATMEIGSAPPSEPMQQPVLRGSSFGTAPSVSGGGSSGGVMRGGSALSQLCALITKRRLQAQRDVCATCCQLLFPVLLVLAALQLLSLNLEDTGPRLAFTPRTAFGDTHGDSPSLLVPSDALPPNTSSAWAYESGYGDRSVEGRPPMWPFGGSYPPSLFGSGSTSSSSTPSAPSSASSRRARCASTFGTCACCRRLCSCTSCAASASTG